MNRLKGVYVLNADAFDKIYGPDERLGVSALIDVDDRLRTWDEVKNDLGVLGDTDVILSGWGGPVLDERLLAAVPRLKAVFYGAGSVAGLVTEAAWARGVVISSAYAANAVPVAEYTLATILFSLKWAWRYSREIREQRRFPELEGSPPPGAYGSTVGFISFGMIGRTVRAMLDPFAVNVLAFDPFMTAQQASELRVELVSLDQLFRRSDVVSVHTPLLEETRGLITGPLLDSMKPGATFINTARGGVVCEPAMIDVAARRPDLQFILDVTDPEPPVPHSPLYTLPNVLLTPHVAGSVGTECRRMGRSMVDELRRYVHGEPLKWAVTPELAARSSHRPASLKAKTNT